MRRIYAFFAAPAQDVFRGLDRCLDGGFRSLLLVALGLALGWFVYVPLHELLHAAGCAWTGGEVSRLEIAPLYGGRLLAHVFPFVTAGSAYAGRLSGFETHGSDAIYLATDLGPFVLTLIPGVAWLRWAGRERRALLYGAALPFALAPFLSLSGDAYEIGSILVTRLTPWSAATISGLLRGDDLALRIEALRSAADAPWGGLILAAGLGLLWAFATYALGGWIARKAGQPPTGPREAKGQTSSEAV